VAWSVDTPTQQRSAYADTGSTRLPGRKAAGRLTDLVRPDDPRGAETFRAILDTGGV
jgi:hypothetical protein